MEDKFVSPESIDSRASLCYEQHLFHSEYFCTWGIKKDVFCGINFCDVGIYEKKCGIYFWDPNVLTKFIQPSLKKEIQYIWE